MTFLQKLLFIIIAACLGTVANAFAASVAIGPSKLDFMFVPGRYGIAILVALLMLVIYQLVQGKAGFILSVIAMTAAASVLAKLYFGAGAPWSLVLSLNLVYAAVTATIYTILLRLFASR